MKRSSDVVLFVTLALLACASVALAQGGPVSLSAGLFNNTVNVPADGVELLFPDYDTTTGQLYAVSTVNDLDTANGYNGCSDPANAAWVTTGSGTGDLYMPGVFMWPYASLFWKLHSTDPLGFAGKYLIADVTYTSAQRGRKRGFFGLGTNAPTHANPSWCSESYWNASTLALSPTPVKAVWNPAIQVDLWGDVPGKNGYGSGNRVICIPMPAGTDFYAGFLNDFYLYPAGVTNSDQIVLHSLKISNTPYAMSNYPYGYYYTLTPPDTNLALMNTPAPGDNPNTINLATATTNYVNTFQSSSDLSNSVYLVGGNAASTTTSVMAWQGPGSVLLTPYNYQTSSPFWKVHTNVPTGFADGSVVRMTFNYTSAQSGRVRGTVCCGTQSPTIQASNGWILWPAGYTPEYQEDIWGDEAGLPGYGSLDRMVTLPLPPSVQDAYFGFSGAHSGPSDSIVLKSIEVDQVPPDDNPLLYGTYANTINLAANQDYSNTFGTLGGLKQSLYAVGGYDGDADGISVVDWQSAGSVQIAPPTGSFGSVFWHLHTDVPGGFTGGIARVAFTYANAATGADRGFVGMSTTAPTINDDATGATTWNPPAKTTITNTPGGGTVIRMVELNLPVGSSDAYFGIMCNGDAPAVLTLNSMSVDQLPVSTYNISPVAYGNTNIVGPSGTWSTSFASPGEVVNDLWSLGGYDGTAVTWYGPSLLVLCDTSWIWNTALWKFHTDNAAGFASSMLNLNFGYYSAQSGRVRGRFGVSTYAPYIDGNGNISPAWTPVTSVTVWGNYPGCPSWGYLERDLVFSLPAGQDFTFGFEGCYAGTSDQVYMKSITIEPPPNVNNIKDAKTAEDGATVGISNALVSIAFTDYFYIQADNRANGIRVNMTGHGLTVPTRANVFGTVATVNGERCINAISVSAVTSTDTALPVGMNNKALGGGNLGYAAGPPISGQEGISGGAGLNNIGLLVKAWGNVSGSSANTFYISDGAGAPILVQVTDGSAPTSGYVRVTGALSCGFVGGQLLPVIVTKASLVH